MGNKLFSRYLEARWGEHGAPTDTVAVCPLCAGGFTQTLWGFLLKMYLVLKAFLLFVPSDSGSCLVPGDTASLSLSLSAENSAHAHTKHTYTLTLGYDFLIFLPLLPQH